MPPAIRSDGKLTPKKESRKTPANKNEVNTANMYIVHSFAVLADSSSLNPDVKARNNGAVLNGLAIGINPPITRNT